jgi:formylglycine-generating enzyme required for sulfatase activity
MRYLDLWNGKELKLENDTLAFPIEALGFAAILAQPEPADAAFLAEMALLSAKPLASFSKTWEHVPQQLVRIAGTAPATQTPPGMIAIPANPAYLFDVHGIEIEGGDDIGVDVQYPWEDSPRRHHSHPVEIAPFYIDQYPVTNQQFAAYLAATSYRPADDHNFLRDWADGRYPAGWDNKPVTWVSLEDARAYAAWAGKRLPHEWEWQYAAQGTDHRLYPWGNIPCDTCAPKTEHGRELRAPTDVGAFPKGASPYGVMDLTGNVWQWTDEFQDEHTRTAILRGGAYYRPDGSRWYFPAAYKLNEHGKYLLMAPSKDRAGTLGFRCVKDAH